MVPTHFNGVTNDLSRFVKYDQKITGAPYSPGARSVLFNKRLFGTIKRSMSLVYKNVFLPKFLWCVKVSS